MSLQPVGFKSLINFYRGVLNILSYPLNLFLSLSCRLGPSEGGLQFTISCKTLLPYVAIVEQGAGKK